MGIDADLVITIAFSVEATLVALVATAYGVHEARKARAEAARDRLSIRGG